MTSEIRLSTDAWYSDREITLLAPAHWDVTTHWPDTPPPLTDAEILDSLARPIGQPAIRQLCFGKTRPLIVIDDLNRPTPTDRLLPLLLNEFASRGINREYVRILLASGTHGKPTAEAVRRKVGPEAASSCRILLHDPERDCRHVGTTSFGTPLMVNAEVLASDFVVGIGGIYPNQTAGFGGGSKLALGVLGMRSIMHLHYRHAAVGWGRVAIRDNFRKDLDEIASMIKLRTVITVLVNARRQAVRTVCGDHFRFYHEEVQFARRVFSAPPPHDADVILSNAYPNDLSLTFARMKGSRPFQDAGPGMSRIAVASCSEGLGQHGLFPIQARRRYGLHTFRLISALGSARLIRKVATRIRQSVQAPEHRSSRNPIWLLPPNQVQNKLLQIPSDMKLAACWSDVLRAIECEQAGKQNVRVVVYPCAPLQFLEPTLARHPLADAYGSALEPQHI